MSCTDAKRNMYNVAIFLFFTNFCINCSVVKKLHFIYTRQTCAVFTINFLTYQPGGLVPMEFLQVPHIKTIFSKV